MALPEEIVLRASRLSLSNFLFPASITLRDTELIYQKKRLFKGQEQFIISYASITGYSASGLFLRTVKIYASRNVSIKGLWIGSARKLRKIIKEQGGRLK